MFMSKTLLLTLLLTAPLAFLGCNAEGEDLNKVLPKLIDEWKGPGNVEAAAGMFNADNPDIRRISVAHISKKQWGHEPPYMKAYRQLATDPQPLVRGQAMLALGSSGQADVADVLITGLGDTSPLVRRDAAAALKDITNPAAIDPLLEHLKNDPDAQTRVFCAQALRNYSTPRTILGLAQALDDKDAAVIEWSWKSLTQITGKDWSKTDSRPWLEYAQSLAKPAPK